MSHEEVKSRIRAALEKAKNPVILYDLTPKSRELVDLVHSIKDVPLLVFKDFRDVNFNPKWTVFYYRPFHIKLRGDKVIAYYALKKHAITVETTIERGTKCGLEQWRTGVQPHYMWDLTLTAGEQWDEGFINPFGSVFNDTVSTKMCFNCLKGNYCYCPKLNTNIHGLKQADGRDYYG